MAERHIGLDTSIVLRLLTGVPAAQAQAAVTFLDRLHREKRRPVVSDLVLSEVYYALQYHYQVPKAEALSVLRAFVDADEISVLGVGAQVLKTENLAAVKPGFLDRLIHAQYAAAGAPYATFERAAKKLSGTEVL